VWFKTIVLILCLVLVYFLYIFFFICRKGSYFTQISGIVHECHFCNRHKEISNDDCIKHKFTNILISARTHRVYRCYAYVWLCVFIYLFNQWMLLVTFLWRLLVFGLNFIDRRWKSKRVKYARKTRSTQINESETSAKRLITVVLKVFGTRM
jgi:hypothetical protein